MKMRLSYFLAAVLLLSFGCAKKADKEEIQQVKDEAAFDEQTQVTSQRFNEVVGFSDIENVTANLMSTGVDYDGSIIVDPGKADDFLAGTDESIAIILGMYYMDLHYTAGMKQGDVSGQVLESANKLAQKIGVAKVLEQAVNEDFASRVNDDPEVKAYVSKLFEDSNKNLNTDSRSRLSALIMTGAFIERAHIMSEIIKNGNPELDEEIRTGLVLPMAVSLYNEESKIDKLIEYVNVVRNPEDPSEFFNGLYAISDAYDQVDAEIKANSVQEGGEPNLEVLDPVMQAISVNRESYIAL